MAQISLTFPDGNARDFDAGVTPAEVAASISTSLGKKAISATVNGAHHDLQWPIDADASIAIHTLKDDAQALELIRHDCAHIMARAVQEIWPDVKVTIGPVIENGFYYDFDRAEPFTPEDLGAIEAKMKEIINARDPVRTEVWDRPRAIAHYEANGEPYKVELIEAIPGNEPLRMYWHGDWQDLCRGPHLQHTGQVPADSFKLMSVAGAYWRGDSSRPMLQRIYGVAFQNRDALKKHLHMLEEAAKRDHRKLGREMNLFHMQEEAPGQVFWHPNGWTVYTTLQDYMRRRQRENGYVEVNTPQVVDRKLWEASGHWDKYQENMFIVEVDEEHAREKAINALKPMNCPCHVQVYNQGLKSYRDLPLRMAEFGACNRYEPSGALHGLMRVRGFTQDDAHIFCTEDQIQDETARFIRMLSTIYRDLGFESFDIKFSTRPEVRAGSDAVWDKAEAALEAAIRTVTDDFELDPGEGAFYGPKLDFKLTDAIGREWQLGTFQADFVLPERLDATYIGEDGAKHRPVMLHRAILGSFERFLGILIENFAGKLPFWLAPRQVVVASIISEADDYVREVVAALTRAGIRAEADIRNEKINYKVREHSVGKVPVILAVGRREMEERTVTLRRLGEKQTSVVGLDALVADLAAEATPPDQRPDQPAV
ncbi:threonyl-tRNA synthetase [Dinoroseobacter shibae DFL 12 = DSM 16493]|jgi:threonyl-tRNA synthetase|uniref:Threonine--tRNA ligase n=1 Tax=Dinoroseobacter shibae (strain DSM 16493 / NCIMB 14021 / DFL 12) TaxID=398580 RepID=SYT_DINSH|nr:threonine--tRNA ligase [Dinoroseobacter shibae]A8LQX9.1 RecName: Full=Threonine--tRNA ligase; AltName: Full=Threonyl-tRNA synthetase; Short=ThrRS [Dinoroseobacter shibae DFL 12 = DSM 16493]ABV92522.1 threonyl-tRNA synthetase [Dinoroseobacter shibae DFL 12 = DSM 16493]URF47466.1 threonine--tRNA ligase [Dinoroseobacter shibae]URF51777.1 threonine--tRNA ligase [Dinoroseobacter shibae]